MQLLSSTYNLAANSRLIARTERFLLTAALVVGWLGAILLMLADSATYSLSHALSPLSVITLLSVLAVGLHLWANLVAADRDPFLLPATVLLSAIGLLAISRVAPNFLLRQIIWLVIGFALMGLVITNDNPLRWLRRFKYTWLILSLILLAATLFLGVNPTGSGARLWLQIASIFVQPSESLRLLMIAFLASFLAERPSVGSRAPSLFEIGKAIRIQGLRPKLRHILHVLNLRHIFDSNLAPSVLMWLIASALLFTQQDLGAAVLLLSTFVTMLYLGTGRRRLPLFGLIVITVAGIVGYFLSARVAQRIDIWLNPWVDAQDRAFQVVQSLIAVANGGLFGQGLGQGSPDYVPAVHTDFPFAFIMEEMGLLGGIAVLVLFAVLSLRGWRIAERAAQRNSNRFEQLLAGGIAASIAIQVFVIVGGNLKVLPLTGVTLPLISYGGSSLCISLIAVGLLMRLSTASARSGSPPQARPEIARANHNMPRICAALFAILGLACGYWTLIQGPTLIARNDNPRRVDAELAIARGPILARDGTPLALSTSNPSTGIYTRSYPISNTAAAIGFYSVKYGVSGLEAIGDADLRGQLSDLDRLLHRVQRGRAITSTIDLAVQAQLAQALNGHIGAAIATDWRTGEVLGMLSSPSFDGNQLDRDWDRLVGDQSAPLINRVTHGLYQPGQVLAWLHRQAFGTDLSVANYTDLAKLNLDQSVAFDLPNEAVPLPSHTVYSDTIGQGALRLTPLRLNASVVGWVSGQARPLTLRQPTQPSANPASPPTPFTFQETTDNGPGRAVTWLITLRKNIVITLVIEHAQAETPTISIAAFKD